MRRRHHFAVIVLVGILSLGLVGKAPGDAADQLREAARLAGSGNSNQAEQIYRTIATGQMGTDAGLDAQEKITCLYVADGRDTEAEAALAALRSGYRQNATLPGAVTRVGDAYRKAAEHEKACDVYGYVVENWPENEYALWSQMDLAVCKAALKDVGGARAAFERLCTQYSGNNLLPKAVCVLGDNYRQIGQPDRARQMYEYALEKWPEAGHAFWSQAGLAMANILLMQDEAAKAAVEKVVGQGEINDDVETAAYLIAETYRQASKHEEAVELYEYVVDNRPAGAYALRAVTGLAMSNIRLKRDSAANTACNKLLADFSADANAPAAICWVGDEYRKTGKYDRACELYEHILEKHPDCEHAFWAQMNLALSKINLHDDAGAKEAVEKVLAYANANDSRVAWAARTMADEYSKAGKNEDAFELYEYVVSDHGRMKDALWSQMNLAIWKVRLGDPNADGETDKLLADYSRDSDAPAAICWLADEYRRSGSHDDALRLYRRVLQEYPDAEHAVWSQMGLVISSIELGDEPNAQDALAYLLVDYGERNGFDKGILSVARQYYEQKDFQKSNEVFETVLEVLKTLPEEKKGLWTGVAEAASNVHLGNDEAAQAALDKMVADFNDHPDLPLALWRAADAYYYSGSRLQGADLPEKGAEQLRKVIELGRRIREKLPATDDTVEAWFFSGEAGSHIGEYEQAKGYFQKVVDMWPEHTLAASAQYRVGQTYKFMMRDGQISYSEGRVRVKEAYEKVVENYPESYLAEWAAQWIESNGIYFAGEEK